MVRRRSGLSTRGERPGPSAERVEVFEFFFFRRGRARGGELKILPLIVDCFHRSALPRAPSLLHALLQFQSSRNFSLYISSRRPRTFHSRSTAVSAAPHARTLPASASVVVEPVKIPSALRWPTLICTAAWSLAVMSLLVHELCEERVGGLK
jgi:hypothetical protein